MSGCVNVETDMRNPSYRLNTSKYNRVFGVHASQHEVFGVACRPLIDAVLRGFNGTLMAYGQTGSGKTYTMVCGHVTFFLSLSSFFPSPYFMCRLSFFYM
jgi:hypothetical protein